MLIIIISSKWSRMLTLDSKFNRQIKHFPIIAQQQRVTRKQKGGGGLPLWLIHGCAAQPGDLYSNLPYSSVWYLLGILGWIIPLAHWVLVGISSKRRSFQTKFDNFFIFMQYSLIKLLYNSVYFGAKSAHTMGSTPL